LRCRFIDLQLGYREAHCVGVGLSVLALLLERWPQRVALLVIDALR
jgi:hypothetical protein